MTSDELAGFCRLDEAGFLPAPGEDSDAYLRRVNLGLDAHRQFEEHLTRNGTVVVFGEVEVSSGSRIPPEIVAEATGRTRELYDFEIRHVPGFFLSRGIGPLWGGCMIGNVEEGFSVFLIRDAFRNHSKWLFYRRDELLAHELCHSMRQPLRDTVYEEHFAYQTSPSPLRRVFGNCFVRDRDALLFVFPTLLLLAAEMARSFLFPQLPVWPFWIGVCPWPVHLLIRNARARRKIRKAAQALQKCGIPRPLPILFRCTGEEIAALGSLNIREELDAFVAERARIELRWKIMEKRFMTAPLPPEMNGKDD